MILQRWWHAILSGELPPWCLLTPPTRWMSLALTIVGCPGGGRLAMAVAVMMMMAAGFGLLCPLTKTMTTTTMTSLWQLSTPPTMPPHPTPSNATAGSALAKAGDDFDKFNGKINIIYQTYENFVLHYFYFCVHEKLKNQTGFHEKTTSFGEVSGKLLFSF